MKSVEKLEVFTMTDQPTTCVRCGSRTEFKEESVTQTHQCLNKKCRYKFIIEDSYEE